MQKSLFLTLFLLGCSQSDESLAKQLAADLAKACPMADAGDGDAHTTCAKALIGVSVLRDHMTEPFLWGGQQPDKGWALAAGITRFNGRVWRQTYLSTLMFNGEHRIEKEGNTTRLHLAFQFRNMLDAGAYPYPFWHSAKKWASYEQAKELVFIISEGKIHGALRSLEKDETKPTAPREWDGQWVWNQHGVDEPRVTLFTNLFSSTNPHVGALTDAYRALSDEYRTQECNTCHSPDNQGAAAFLDLLNYPNQSLVSRHRLVHELETNGMPPPENTKMLPPGLPEEKRVLLLELAKEFARLADEALAYEGEPAPGE